MLRIYRTRNEVGFYSDGRSSTVSETANTADLLFQEEYLQHKTFLVDTMLDECIQCLVITMLWLHNPCKNEISDGEAVHPE